MIDKNFFLHDLSVVAIIKNDAHYLEEWLNYHLVAGVDHFYLYDNGSSDNTREILDPYIETEIVDLFSVTGDSMQIPVYNDATRRFKFATRYMAFIDTNEFILPKGDKSVVDVVDEVLSPNPHAAALVANWQIFGSNNLEKADFEKGVLERFTRRAPRNWFEPLTEEKSPSGNIFVKTIANPRFIRAVANPHFAFYFDGKFAVNSAGGRVPYWGNESIQSDKIVINRYFTRSKEEFQSKSSDMSIFEKFDRNDETDDDILKYQELRIDKYSQPLPFEQEKNYKILEEFLLPAVRQEKDEFFQGKLETFLTCRALAGVLKRNAPKDNRGKFLEEASLRLVNRTHSTQMTFAEIMMMINALPPILSLPYPVVNEVRQNCISFIRQIMADLHRNSQWEEFVEFGNYLELLMAFGNKTGE